MVVLVFLLLSLTLLCILFSICLYLCKVYSSILLWSFTVCLYITYDLIINRNFHTVLQYLRNLEPMMFSLCKVYYHCIRGRRKNIQYFTILNILEVLEPTHYINQISFESVAHGAFVRL